VSAVIILFYFPILFIFIVLIFGNKRHCRHSLPAAAKPYPGSAKCRSGRKARIPAYSNHSRQWAGLRFFCRPALELATIKVSAVIILFYFPILFIFIVIIPGNKRYYIYTRFRKESCPAKTIFAPLPLQLPPCFPLL
jgi:hypothetical protein